MNVWGKLVNWQGVEQIWSVTFQSSNLLNWRAIVTTGHIIDGSHPGHIVNQPESWQGHIIHHPGSNCRLTVETKRTRINETNCDSWQSLLVWVLGLKISQQRRPPWKTRLASVQVISCAHANQKHSKRFVCHSVCLSTARGSGYMAYGVFVPCH